MATQYYQSTKDELSCLLGLIFKTKCVSCSYDWSGVGMRWHK